MKKISIYLIILVIVLIGLVGVVIGERNELEVLSAIKQKFVVFIQDSRIINVEKPCMADEVTIDIKGYMVTGNGINCEKAKKICRMIATNYVWEKANEECQLYAKTQNTGEICHAYRGNFNPTKDLTYGKCYIGNDRDTLVKCTIQKVVDYTCN